MINLWNNFLEVVFSEWDGCTYTSSIWGILKGCPDPYGECEYGFVSLPLNGLQ